MDLILQYYETELDYMRRAFDAFEKSHPQKAKALGISAGRSSDPDIQRLSDSMALHAARLSKRLDETLPETALDLTRIIAPSFLLGAPSYAAVKIHETATSFTDKTVIAAGTQLPIVLTGDTPDCIYTVARDTQLNPLTVQSTRIERAPLPFRAPDALRGCEAAICVTIAALDPSQSLSDINLQHFELYVSAAGGRKQRLVDVLSGDVIGLGYGAASAGGVPSRQTYMLNGDHFTLSMAGETHTFLPREATQPPAISRLRDFLAYPDKAAFFTLSDTGSGFCNVPSGAVELRFFLSSHGANQLSDVSDGDLSVNVVPVVNLYLDQSRPVRYDYARLQVPVKPASSADMQVECLQIKDVRKLTAQGEQLLPRITSAQRRTVSDLPVWQERFQVGEFDAARREISFSINPDLGSSPEPLDFVANLYCANGRAAFAPRPGTIVFFDDEALAGCPFVLLDEPSVPVPPDVKPEKLWDVLSMINGNFASVLGTETPSDALKEALHLCAPSGYTDAANAIWDVTVTQSTAPVRIGKSVLLASGSQIEVVLDIEALPFSRHVFATALHFYFSALISYDRFFQLKVRERGRETPFKVFARQHGGQICG